MSAVAEIGFSLCDSSAALAVSRRRLGSMPLCLALGCADIGEARLADGRQVLTTWGRSVSPDKQFWYSHNTLFQPVWVGADDGSCELILCDSFGHSELQEWLYAGLRITASDGPAWMLVSGGEQ